MRRHPVTVVILLSVLALAGRPLTRPASAQKPSQDPPRAARPGLMPQETPAARAVLMIVGDPLRFGESSLRIADRTAQASASATVGATIRLLIMSSSLRGPEPGEFEGFSVRFTPFPASPEEDTLGLLTVSGRGDVDKALALAQKRLQEALREVHRGKLDPLDRKIALAEKRTARAEARIEHAREELLQLRELALRSGEALEPQDPQLFTSIKRDQLALRAEIAGLQAQREAIIEQIAKTKDKLDAAQHQQRLVLDQLANVVKLHEDAVARTRKLSGDGLATPTELSKAEVALAQARADLADRRRVLVQETGGGQLGRLNERLVETQIAMTTAAARLEETKKALVELQSSAYSPVNPLVIKYQRARRALENAFAEHEAAAAELNRLTLSRDAVPEPKVIVIAGEGKPK